MSYPTTAPAPGTPATGKRRTGLLVLGLVLLLGGVGAGAALFVTSGSTYDDAVTNLQRAPVGCSTEFNFTGTGEFVFYVETKGKVGSLRGDCENTDADYSHSGSLPRPELTLLDADGEDVTDSLETFRDGSYDAAGYEGSSYRTLQVSKAGEYTLTVTDTDDTDYAVSVGRNPKDDADSLQTIAIVVAGAGLVLGLIFIVLGARRKKVAQVQGGFGPGQQPYAAQPYAVEPQYGQQPPQQQPYGQAAPGAPPAPPWQTGPAAPPAPGQYQPPTGPTGWGTPPNP